MSIIQELTAERDRLYEEHNESFQAWMDAEIALKEAIEEGEYLEQQTQRARKYAFLTILGFAGLMTAINWCVL